MFKNVIIDTIVKIPVIKNSISDGDQFFALNILAIQLILEIKVDYNKVIEQFPQWMNFIRKIIRFGIKLN